MRKKLVALSLVAAMLAIGIIGGTLAYFTDTKEKTNTFTLGNVKIELVEKGADGEDFVPDQPLLPGEKNAVDKIVTVENIGSSKAYAWIEVWVPEDLDKNGLELVKDKAVKSRKLADKYQTKEGYVGYIYYLDGDPIEPGKSTGQLLDAVYLSADVTQTEGGLLMTDGTTVYGEDKVNIDVVGVAIQADGFKDISEAIDAYYDEANSSSTETKTETEIESEPTPATAE
jgi:predicted ribosomally synthesized peptide with SipW-like signal peptide